VRLREGCAVFGKKGRKHMLNIYSDVLAWLEALPKVLEQIARCDSDLAKQLKRSSCSVALNLAEGMYARGRQRTCCYGISLREMRESYAALEIAQKLRYIAPLEPALGRRKQRSPRGGAPFRRLRCRHAEPRRAPFVSGRCHRSPSPAGICRGICRFGSPTRDTALTIPV
jgi:four helix bundle protein